MQARRRVFKEAINDRSELNLYGAILPNNMSRYTEKIPRKLPGVVTDIARGLKSNTFLKHVNGTFECVNLSPKLIGENEMNGDFAGYLIMIGRNGQSK
jgi:hypothetical protein